MLTNCRRNCPLNCRSRWYPARNWSVRKITGNIAREERQRFFSYDGKMYRRHRKLDVPLGSGPLDVCHDTCISGTKWMRYWLPPWENILAKTWLRANTLSSRGPKKKRCMEEEKLARPETHDIFHVFKSSREKKKKVRGNTRNQLHCSGGGIFAQKLCVLKKTRGTSFYLPPGWSPDFFTLLCYDLI